MRPVEAQKKNRLLQHRQLQRCPAGSRGTWLCHYILDIPDEFGDFVIDKNTWRDVHPIPACSATPIYQWRVLLKRADALECEFIAGALCQGSPT